LNPEGARAITTGMPVRTRRATGADSTRLLSLIRAFWAFEHLPFEERDVPASLECLLEHPEFGSVWVAERGDELVGYTVLSFGFSLEHGGRDGLIDELFVTDAERGQGVGTALLEAVFEGCRGEGVRSVHLEVDHTNPRAEALYGRLGFRANDRHLLTRRLHAPSVGASDPTP
jgi:GNAT superfamily N-acetyltransferase